MEEIENKMENTQFEMKYNRTKIASVKEFSQFGENTGSDAKDICFVRALGTYDGLSADIAAVDRTLTRGMKEGNGKYVRRNALPGLTDSKEIAFYKNLYEEWLNGGKKAIKSRCLKGQAVEELAGAALRKVMEKFQACTAGVSASMEQNFAIKLMYWTDSVCSVFFQNWKPLGPRRFIYSGSLKKQEYLFCYFLTFFGINVLMIRTETDAEPGKALEHLSADIRLGAFGSCGIPEYSPEPAQTRNIVVNVRRADRDERTRQMQARQTKETSRPVIRDSQSQRNAVSAMPVFYGSSRQELAFEELALLASSIVMITIHDKKGKPLGSGSGIMINEQGYILTNNHVACQGSFYSVRIEGDEQVYQTDEMIKYNQLLDLAIIRIDKTLQPVPFYQGEKSLVRGQKVVAIGSPLGLFNSVSDGIISGFRNIDNVDMIQFTAPISRGSSGGAVFNMYGEVIGISTAGIDYGQNINLAVGYEYINTFIRGFYKEK